MIVCSNNPIKGETMYIFAGKNEMVVCKVAPFCVGYGEEYTIFTFYNDGTIGVQSRGLYARSGNITQKPYREYSINELCDLVNGLVTIGYLMER